MSKDTIKVDYFGEIFPKRGSSTRTPYEHQSKAMEALSILNKEESFSTLTVLPTGGGKTFTATTWLLKNAVNEGKKVLWIAHRNFLLDQAFESFSDFAYESILPSISSFSYRIVSGASYHDRSVNIDPEDSVLIASKASLVRNLKYLNKWLKGEDEIYFVIDEAHHSTAKTYRKIIDYVRKRVKNVKLIGLTATPFRTAESEKGLLSKIYCDGVKDGKVVKGNLGIAYEIGLKELIKRRILSAPVFIDYATGESFGEALSIGDLKKLQMDSIPEKIAQRMLGSHKRNIMIVNTYKENREKFGQTILFAVTRDQAVHLAEIFRENGIPSDYIISGKTTEYTALSIEDNEEKIEKFRRGEIEVLINVNILTEGMDLPQTKTVFLTRPTVSATLMTQMIGRALRGSAAGGTNEAYIVSFIDDWADRIAWVNPETLFEGNNEFEEVEKDAEKYEIQLISLEKISEFARLLDKSISDEEFNRITSTPFVERIPVGMYMFTYLENDVLGENGSDVSCQVMVYDSTKKFYENFLENLPKIFEKFGAIEEFLDDELLSKIVSYGEEQYFSKDIFPTYDKGDIVSLVKYYAQYGDQEVPGSGIPKFYTFSTVDRNRLDVSRIAKTIYEKDMRRSEQKAYVDSLWDDEDRNLLNLFFAGRKPYFVRQINIELNKIENPSFYNEAESNIKRGEKELNNLTLNQLYKVDSKMAEELEEIAYSKIRISDNKYRCPICGRCGYRSMFEVDHIIPMSKGGKTEEGNLQAICRHCNRTKGDKMEGTVE